MILHKIPIKHDFSFSKEVKKLSTARKYFAFKKLLRKRSGYLKTAFTINSKNYPTITSIIDQSTRNEVPKRITYNVPTEVTEEHIEMMRNSTKENPSKMLNLGNDFLGTLALNEICFFTRFSKNQQELVERLDRRQIQKIMKLEHLRIEVSDAQTFGPFGGGGKPFSDDFLIDLKSKCSVKSGSLAGFSFEG